ncbi:MAG TPA: alpha/beta hydrolase [Arenibaculum sp.]|nr:alpha/beta hydrolase [Arenibaculum sp.]
MQPGLEVERIEAGGATFVVETRGLGRDSARLRLVWLHGWGQSRAAMAPLARAFETAALNQLVDMPGFGEAPPPPEDWGTEQYGDMLARWLDTQNAGERLATVLVGHSFGCRVAIRLAARHPRLVDAMVLIAGAGLRRHRPLPVRAKAAAMRIALRLARRVDALAGTGHADRLRERMGSADYRNAGRLRPVLVRVVNEDLAPLAATVRHPVQLVYGELDDQTPPEFGHRFAELMADAELVLLPNFDHYTILSSGRHQVQLRMQQFLDRILPRNPPCNPPLPPLPPAPDTDAPR